MDKMIHCTHCGMIKEMPKEGGQCSKCTNSFKCNKEGCQRLATGSGRNVFCVKHGCPYCHVEVPYGAFLCPTCSCGMLIVADLEKSSIGLVRLLTKWQYEYNEALGRDMLVNRLCPLPDADYKRRIDDHNRYLEVVENDIRDAHS
jgi:hypothetical protein